MIYTIPTGVVISMIWRHRRPKPISIVMMARSHIYAIRVVHAIGTKRMLRCSSARARSWRSRRN